MRACGVCCQCGPVVYAVNAGLLCMLSMRACCVCCQCGPAVYAVNAGLLCMLSMRACCVCCQCGPVVYAVNAGLRMRMCACCLCRSSASGVHVHALAGHEPTASSHLTPPHTSRLLTPHTFSHLMPLHTSRPCRCTPRRLIHAARPFFRLFLTEPERLARAQRPQRGRDLGASVGTRWRSRPHRCEPVGEPW
jgi:hypothetical protein